jgi:hypothetical protein
MLKKKCFSTKRKWRNSIILWFEDIFQKKLEPLNIILVFLPVLFAMIFMILSLVEHIIPIHNTTAISGKVLSKEVTTNKPIKNTKPINIMQSSKVFRIFVSSTFSDLKKEMLYRRRSFQCFTNRVYNTTTDFKLLSYVEKSIIK